MSMMDEKGFELESLCEQATRAINSVPHTTKPAPHRDSDRGTSAAPGHNHKPDGLALTALSDLLDEPEEATAWLVDGLLPVGGFSLLVAKPKVGKSTLARALALAIARGESFFGRPTLQGGVLYVALEEKRSEIRKHFQDMGASGGEEVFIFAASAPVDGLRRIRVEVERKKPALVIVDPIFRLTRVKDSNDYAEVTKALEPILALARETGAHVCCVHHASKGEREAGDSILGSTALLGAVDTALIMKRSESYRTVASIQRYGEDLPETVLVFDPITRIVTLGKSREQEEITRLKAPILDFLAGQEEAVPEKDVKDGVAGNNRHKQSALRELLVTGEVVRHGKGSRGDPYKYSLSHFAPIQKSESENNGKQAEQAQGE